jgi:Arc/MetJ family transcription regulator
MIDKIGDIYALEAEVLDQRLHCEKSRLSGDRRSNGPQHARSHPDPMESVSAKALHAYRSSSMHRHMRTTIELSDALLSRVRRIMAKRKTTLRALVEEGLRRVVEEDRAATAFQLRDASFKGPAGFASGAGPEDIQRVLREVNDSRPLP